MKKRIFIFIPILVALIVIAVLQLVNQGQTPGWQARLNQYLTFLQQTGQHSSRVITAAPATSPDNFTPSMSAESYSDSTIFETTHPQSTGYSISLQPIPYPPDEVMCVLLNIDNQQQLVYVALHDSLYNADWIVHIAVDPWGSATLHSNLVSLGCPLDT